MKRLSFTGLIAAMAAAGAVSACANPAEAAEPAPAREVSDREVRTMKVRMTVEGRALTAMLVDNETSR
jgi:hypothetical protein